MSVTKTRTITLAMARDPNPKVPSHLPGIPDPEISSSTTPNFGQLAAPSAALRGVVLYGVETSGRLRLPRHMHDDWNINGRRGRVDPDMGEQRAGRNPGSLAWLPPVQPAGTPEVYSWRTHRRSIGHEEDGAPVTPPVCCTETTLSELAAAGRKPGPLPLLPQHRLSFGRHWASCNLTIGTNGRGGTPQRFPAFVRFVAGSTASLSTQAQSRMVAG